MNAQKNAQAEKDAQRLEQLRTKNTEVGLSPEEQKELETLEESSKE